MAIGLFEQLNWLTTRVKRLCCAIEQIQQSGAGSYKVYTALLTQNGGYESVNLNNGLLTIGVTYWILDWEGNGVTGVDFTNVGAPNNNAGTYFVATGTTPNSWGTNPFGYDILQYNVGDPVVTVLENTIGNIWFHYDNDGLYSIKSDGLFTSNKTWMPTLTIEYNTLSNKEVDISFQDSSTISLISLSGVIFTNSILFNTPIEIRVYN